MVTLLERVGWFAIYGTTVQAVLLLLFMAFVQYSNVPGRTLTNHTGATDATSEAGLNVYPSKHTLLHPTPPVLGDIQVMILVGFGFLMTFLRRYGHSALGLTLLLTSLALQISLLLEGVSSTTATGTITITIHSLLNGNFASAACLISLGAVLGRTSPTQLLFLVLLEVPVYTLNAHLCLNVLGIVDHGGSIVIHMFGAFFGLGFSKFVTRSMILMPHPKASSTATSDTFSMIGTLFLWVYWPSFNAVLVEGAAARNRAVLNTYLALLGSTFCTFVFSSWVHVRGKWTMTHVQNATLAGGVGVGAVAGLILYPWGALLLGCSAGMLSTLSYIYLQASLFSRTFLLAVSLDRGRAVSEVMIGAVCWQRLLEIKLGLQDTCGVLHLHGLPGVFSACVSIGAALFASLTTFGDELFQQYPLMAPTNTSTLAELEPPVVVAPGEGRSAVHQALFQLLATGVTLLLAVVAGAVSGFAVTFPSCQRLARPQQYNDALWWEEGDEEESEIPTIAPALDVDFPKLFSVQVAHGETGRRPSNVRNGM
ncbi:ammonium transporter Rh type B-like [Portunus trituberculatus]|uniref:ammonium transporter Rh type B-like n=1 Tax=Portunus trituberculatus TaxID=210409 RepID=UPI001E1D0F83|nr:ammonium transporter Rh type B-like [Portunus trituberculatus]